MLKYATHQPVRQETIMKNECGRYRQGFADWRRCGAGGLGGLGGPVWAWIGVVPLATNLTGFCPVYPAGHEHLPHEGLTIPGGCAADARNSGSALWRAGFYDF